MANAPALKPFRFGTVRRSIPLGSYAFVPGNAVPSIQLPQVGMLARISVVVSLAYTAVAGSAINLLDGYDSILSRARVSLNNGSASLFDCSGIGINQVNRTLGKTALPIKRGLSVAAGNQTATYGFYIPISANMRKQMDMGLINLQAPEVRCTLDLSFAPLANIFTNTGNISNVVGSVSVAYEYFEIPDLSQFALPPLTIVRTIEEAPAAINAVGLQTFQIPRLGTMFNYSAALVLNNKYASVLTNVTEFAWKYNLNDQQFDYLLPHWELREAELYQQSNGSTFIDPNAITWNQWAASDRNWNGGDFRDAIDTEENTTTQSLITIAPGVALPAGVTNALYHVRRVVQRVVAAG